MLSSVTIAASESRASAGFSVSRSVYASWKPAMSTLPLRTEGEAVKCTTSFSTWRAEKSGRVMVTVLPTCETGRP